MVPARGGLCGVVLAAGAGTRLRPLTDLRPKALCPVGNVPLLDRALHHLAALGLAGPDVVAVNAHHHAGQIAAAVGDRAQLSIEQPEALGTAGAIGALRDWIAGRNVLIMNADAYLGAPLPGDFVDGWSAVHPRLLVVDAGDRRRDFDHWRFAGASLLPAEAAARLLPEPTGLYEVVWRDAWAAGRLELTPYSGTFIDCGTPADYLSANLATRTAAPAHETPGTPAGTPDAESDAALGAGRDTAPTARRSSLPRAESNAAPTAGGVVAPGARSHAGMVAALGAGRDARTDAALDAGHDAGTHTALGAGRNAGTDAALDAGHDARTDAALDAGHDTRHGATPGAGHDAAPGTGHDATPSAGHDVEVGAAPGAGRDTGMGAALGAGRDTAPGTGSDSGTGGARDVGIDPTAVVTGRVVDSVVGAGAVVEGHITRCVIWPGARVEAHETLVDAIRADNGLTVPV